MAYQQDFLDDENKNQGQQQPATSEQVLSPGSTSLSSPSGTESTGQHPTGSGFTNLSTYVDANKEQSKDMADKVTSGVETSANDVSSGLGTLKSAGEQAVSDNTKQDNGVIGGLKNTPEQFAAQEWQDAYKNQTSGYQGPNTAADLTPYQDVSTKLNTANAKANSLDTQEGVGQTLRDTYKNPQRTYTQGENTLDSFLTTSGEGANQLKAAKDAYNQKDLTGQFGATEADINSKLNTAKDTTNKTKTDTESAYNDSLNNIQNTFSQRMNEAATEKQRIQDEAKAYTDRLAAGNTSGTGLTPEAAKYLNDQKYDLTKLVNTPTQFRNFGDMVTDQEHSGYDALLGLTPGQQEQYDFSKTGTTPGVGFNNIDQANQLATQAGALDSRRFLEQNLRDAKYKKMQEATDYLSSDFGLDANDPKLASYSASLGLSPEDMAYAKSNLSHSLNPADFFSKGKDLNVGDIASQTDRDSLNKLMSSLGLDSSKYQDTQDEGSAYNYNADVIKNAIANDKINQNLRAAQSPVVTESSGKKNSTSDALLAAASPATYVQGKLINPAKKILGF